jgi:dihydroxyacetone kinase-like predicted kinase
VEGDQTLVKVHVHVPDPGVALSYAVSLGFVTDVVVENMDDMALPEMPPGYDPVPPRFIEEARPEQHVAAMAEENIFIDEIGGCTEGSLDGPGVIAVAPGAGLAKVFRSLGAHCIVSGGQTMNPSTQDLLEAVTSLDVTDVVILPNNGNIIMAAGQAQALAASQGKNVAVIPSKTVPQGISALLALNPHADLQHNQKTMSLATGHVQTGEVTIAVQDAAFDGVTVQAGDVIGLLNDVLTTKGTGPEAVVLALLSQMDAASLEVVTLYYGQPVTHAEAEALQKELAQVYPDQAIEIVNGGQPFYHYIISAE